LLRYSDRILVSFAGMVSGPIDAATTSVDELGQLIGGSTITTTIGAPHDPAGAVRGGDRA